MPRPCCPARKEFPELHRVFLATEPEHLRWFGWLTRTMLGKVGVDAAETIARVGYKHDPNGDLGLGYLTAFLADHLDGAKAQGRGASFPTNVQERDSIFGVIAGEAEDLRRRLGREPTRAELAERLSGDTKYA